MEKKDRVTAAQAETATELDALLPATAPSKANLSNGLDLLCARRHDEGPQVRRGLRRWLTHATLVDGSACFY